MTPDTFSFFDVLEEVTYPKDVFSVYMDEAAAFDFQKLSVEIDMSADPSPEKITEFKERAEAIAKRLANSKYTFYVSGVSDDRIELVTELVNKEFEDKKQQRYTATKTIEKYLPEEHQMAYVKFFNAAVLSLHIEQIVKESDGRVMTAPDPKEVIRFMDRAPEAAKAEVNNRIKALRVKSSAYENALDEGFLAKS